LYGQISGGTARSVVRISHQHRVRGSKVGIGHTFQAARDQELESEYGDRGCVGVVEVGDVQRFESEDEAASRGFYVLGKYCFVIGYIFGGYCVVAACYELNYGTNFFICESKAIDYFRTSH